jgi:hypothetical protein
MAILELLPPRLYLRVGQMVSLKVRGHGIEDRLLVSLDLCWHSTHPEIVQISNGWLSALQPGQAQITAIAGSYFSTPALVVVDSGTGYLGCGLR